MNIAATLRYQSGQPYTDDEQFLGLIYNKRTPNEFNLRLRLQKTFMFNGGSFILFLEGYNLLNQQVYSEDVFDDQNEDNLLERYKSGERESLIWYDWETSGGREDDYRNRYKVSQEQEIYRNNPRFFRIGLEVRL